MSKHAAVVTTKVHGPLEILYVPTITPREGEVRVRLEWTASTPFDLHQNDGGLLAKHPQVMGDGIAGTVVEVGPGVKRLKVGTKVFGFAWREQKEKAHQEFSTLPEYLLGELPSGFTPQEAVTLPDNFVTAFHAITTDLGLPLPWPKPADYAPPNANVAILIWGGSSSAGQFALQVLKYYGYRNLLATASKKHHELLKSYGAAQVFDYREPDVVEQILAANQSGTSGKPDIALIYDCIGSLSGSVEPIARLAQKGSTVAILLPVITKDSTDSGMPEYAMDVAAVASWQAGVETRGIRTHSYLENGFFRDHLQSEIMPAMLAQGVVKPNKQRIVEGKTLLERAENAMTSLRRKEASGERLVWRIRDE